MLNFCLQRSDTIASTMIPVVYFLALLIPSVENFWFGRTARPDLEWEWEPSFGKGEISVAEEWSGSVSGRCNLGWLEYEGSCYSFNQEKLSWYEAAATCFVYESHLVQVESAEENAWLNRQLAKANIRNAWLGGTARLHRPVWEWVPSFRQIGDVEEGSGSEWVSGSISPTTFVNWAAGEPNNAAQNREDCLEASYLKNYKWNDVNCEHSNAFICEKYPEHDKR